jgi:dienelactone hydrolase
VPRQGFGPQENLEREAKVAVAAKSRLIALAATLLCALGSTGAGAQEVVHFPSLDDQHTMLDGYLYRAPGAGRHPAVVGLHGCGGMFFQNRVSALEFAWAYLFTSHGWDALLVDSFGPRQHGEMCSIGGFDLAIFRARPRDAYGALAWLQARDDVRPDRVAAMGWSQGGGTVLMAVGEPSPGRPSPPTRADFRAAVAFYPAVCRDDREPAGWTTKVPLLVLQGEADVWTPAPPCKAFIDGAIARGAPAQIVLYPCAYHSFDAPNLARRELPNYVTRAGVVPIVATDPAARADAQRRVTEFFARYLAD